MTLSLIHKDIEDSCGGVDGHVGPNATDDQPSELHGDKPFLGMNLTKPGMSVLQDAPCEEKVPVGMMLRENRSYPFVAGSETPTGNSFLESVRNATITCQECGVRAQMRCSCGVMVCLRHVYDIDGDLYCSSCVVYIRAERNIQDDLTLEMYKNIARRR